MRRFSLAVAVLLALAAVPILSPQDAHAAPPDSSAMASPQIAPAPPVAAVENVLAFSGTGVAQGAAATVMVSALSPDVATAAADLGSRFLAVATSDWSLALVAASILIGLALRAGPSGLNRSKPGQPGDRSTRHLSHSGQLTTASG